MGSQRARTWWMAALSPGGVAASEGVDCNNYTFVGSSLVCIAKSSLCGEVEL
jgi:hypothetical protein